MGGACRLNGSGTSSCSRRPRRAGATGGPSTRSCWRWRCCSPALQRRSPRPREQDKDLAQALITVLGWAAAFWRLVFVAALVIALVIVVGVLPESRAGPLLAISCWRSVAVVGVGIPPRRSRRLGLASDRAARPVALGLPRATGRRGHRSRHRRRPRARPAGSSARVLARRAWRSGRRRYRRSSAVGRAGGSRARTRRRPLGSPGLRNRSGCAVGRAGARCPVLARGGSRRLEGLGPATDRLRR